jgi:TetR/AcrR family transcriptional regulator
MKQLTKRKRTRAPRRDGETERRILDAAHDVFVRRGTAGTRMQEIAAEARVNQALLHYYFRSKDQLARAAFEHAGAQLMPAVIQVMAGDGEIEAKVARVIDLELDHLSRSPYLPGYIIGEVTHHPERVPQLIAAITGRTADDIRSRVLGRLQRQIDARVAAGTMRPIAAPSFMVNLLSLCIFPFAVRPLLMALFGADDRQFAAFIERRRSELADFFLQALRP